MLYTRTITLAFIIVAILVGTVTAPTASAQVEVTDENGTHCSAVTLTSTFSASGGCLLSVHSVGALNLEAFGALVSRCDTFLNWRIDEDGHGYIYDQALTGPDCTSPPCLSWPSNLPAVWETELSETAWGVVGEAQYCLVSSALGVVNCHLPNIGIGTSTHYPTLDLWALPCEGDLGFIHLTGGATTLSFVGLEINH